MEAGSWVVSGMPLEVVVKSPENVKLAILLFFS